MLKVCLRSKSATTSGRQLLFRSCETCRGLMTLGSEAVARPFSRCYSSNRVFMALLTNKQFSTACETSSSGHRSILPKRIVESVFVRRALPPLGNTGYFCLAAGFVMTDILALRMMLVGGYSCVTAFHALQTQPLLIPLRWSALFALINAFMALKLGSERFVWLSEEEDQIYRDHFELTLTKPEFKKLFQCGQIATATENCEVVKAGEVANLVLLVEGEAEVHLGSDMEMIVARAGLLGESSFLRRTSASKTVHVRPGCRYIVWGGDVLNGVLEREPSLRRGLELTIGRELSRKLGETTNTLMTTTSGVNDIARQQALLEYEGVVLRYALRLATQERARDEPASPSVDLFSLLAGYRHRERVPDEVHLQVMSKLGIDEERSVRDGTLLKDVFNSTLTSPMPQPSVSLQLPDQPQEKQGVKTAYQKVSINGPGAVWLKSWRFGSANASAGIQHGSVGKPNTAWFEPAVGPRMQASAGQRAREAQNRSPASTEPATSASEQSPVARRRLPSISIVDDGGASLIENVTTLSPKRRLASLAAGSTENPTLQPRPQPIPEVSQSTPSPNFLDQLGPLMMRQVSDAPSEFSRQVSDAPSEFTRLVSQ